MYPNYNDTITQIEYTLKCYRRYSQYGKTDTLAYDIQELINDYKRSEEDKEQIRRVDKETDKEK